MLTNKKVNILEKNLKTITNLIEINYTDFQNKYTEIINILNNQAIFIVYFKIYKNNTFISQIFYLFINFEYCLKNKKNTLNLNEFKNLFILSQKENPTNSIFRKNKLSRLCKYIILDNEIIYFEFEINKNFTHQSIIKTLEYSNDLKKAFKRNKRPITREIIKRKIVKKSESSNILTNNKCKIIINDLIKEKENLELELKNSKEPLDHNNKCLIEFDLERKIINNFKKGLKLSLNEKIKLKEYLFNIGNINKINEYGMNDKQNEFLNTTMEGNQLIYKNYNNLINSQDVFNNSFNYNLDNDINSDEIRFKEQYIKNKLIYIDNNINNEYNKIKKNTIFSENIEYLVLVYENNIKKILKEESFLKSKLEKKLFHFLSEELKNIKINQITNKDKYIEPKINSRIGNISLKYKSNDNFNNNVNEIKYSTNNNANNKTNTDIISIQDYKLSKPKPFKPISQISTEFIKINNYITNNNKEIDIFNSDIKKSIEFKNNKKIEILPIKKRKKIKIKRSLLEKKKKGLDKKINIENSKKIENLKKRRNNSIFNSINKNMFKSLSRNKKINKNEIYRQIQKCNTKLNNLSVKGKFKKLLDNSSKHLYDEFENKN